jgi:hypothetical protein
MEKLMKEYIAFVEDLDVHGTYSTLELGSNPEPLCDNHIERDILLIIAPNPKAALTQAKSQISNDSRVLCLSEDIEGNVVILWENDEWKISV